MNSEKVESLTVGDLKRAVNIHSYMQAYINDNDKEPSWDGHIYLYSNKDMKAESIKYRVLVQVKGKNKEELIKRERITYPVKYKHLRNYYHDGGVCYFVLVISDDGEKTVIFCNALTPIKLQDCLKGTESKGGEQTKNITLERVRNKVPNELYKILMQFGHDSSHQGKGDGELLRKTISLDDWEKIDSLRMTAYVSSSEEAIKKISTGEACIYGHRADFDIWLPLAYDEQKKMEIIESPKIEMVQKSFCIDRVEFYDEYSVETISDTVMLVHLSENLTLDIASGKISFNPVTKFEEIERDIKFLEAISKGQQFSVDDKTITTYNDVKIPEDLRKNIEDIGAIIAAFKKFDVICDKRVDEFTDENWGSVDKLKNVYLGKIRPKEEYAWCMWWWEGKVVPILVVKTPDGAIDANNIITMKELAIGVPDGDIHYRVPNFALFKRDIWEKLYDIDEEILHSEIESSDFNNVTEGALTNLFVEILSAYDSVKNEKYYNIAKLISDNINDMNSRDDYHKINRLQLVKRKRELIEEELNELEKIVQQSDNKMVVCAANILLENKHQAKKGINELSDDKERELFMSYPRERFKFCVNTKN